MGFRIRNAKQGLQKALAAGAKVFSDPSRLSFEVPSIEGIGGSMIYFVEAEDEREIYQQHFIYFSDRQVFSVGLEELDHVTHNVFRGNMDVWANFYEKIFNFYEIRYFDIQGIATGLLSRAMSSPCGKIRIPLNESTDEQSKSKSI